MRSEGYAGHATPYDLFAEMEDKDPHLFSALQTRKLGVLAGWQAGLLHLLDALGKGMAVVEVLWGFDVQGRIVPRALRPRAAQRFIRGAGGEWRLLRAETGPGGVPFGHGELLPPRKFIIALYGADDERPYGKGLCERVYWLWWFKKHNIRVWLVHNEKFGSPTVVARHRPGLSDAEHERLLQVIDAIHQDAGVTIPEGIQIELLEATRAGGADTYRALAQWCNDEISRAILGQTLTASEGERSGSLALGRVHEAVRRDYMRADAWMLMDVVNTQLIRWLVDFNFGENVPAPRWTIDLAEQPDLAAEVAVDRQLLQMGVSLPESYFYEKYGRPAPAADQRRLEHDDSNVYHYHLQYGVLTINEVRAKLGLPPVAWGDRPTSPAVDAITLPTPGPAAGEAAPPASGTEDPREPEQIREE